MTRTILEPTVRWTAFAAGFVATALAIAGLQMARGSGRSDLGISFLANATGQLEVKPVGTVLRARGLRAGEGARGRLTLENITDRPVAVHLRAGSAGHDVDDLLEVRITADRRTLFVGPLGELRRWTKRALRLRPAQRAQLALQAWIPEGRSGGFRGRAGDVTLGLSQEGN